MIRLSSTLFLQAGEIACQLVRMRGRVSGTSARSRSHRVAIEPDVSHGVRDTINRIGSNRQPPDFLYFRATRQARPDHVLRDTAVAVEVNRRQVAGQDARWAAFAD